MSVKRRAFIVLGSIVAAIALVKLAMPRMVSARPDAGDASMIAVGPPPPPPRASRLVTITSRSSGTGTCS